MDATTSGSPVATRIPANTATGPSTRSERIGPPTSTADADAAGSTVMVSAPRVGLSWFEKHGADGGEDWLDDDGVP